MRTLLFVALFLSVTPLPLPSAPSCEAEAQVYFSPNGGCTQAIVNEINGAKKSVHILAYYFTSAPIAEAVVKAHRRGVSVTAVLDKSQQTAKYSSADFLQRAGVDTYIDRKHTIQHSKIIIIDGEKVLTGSFNFTKAAEESNAENLIVLKGREVALVYLKNWQVHREHAERYVGKTK